jgi:hypothetical protein
MNLSIDPVVLVNLALCIVILVLGIWEYSRTRAKLALYIALAFGLFGISHLMILLNLGTGITPLLITIRLAAYLLVIFGLSRVIKLGKPV